jgi:hypothetical protein
MGHVQLVLGFISPQRRQKAEYSSHREPLNRSLGPFFRVAQNAYLKSMSERFQEQERRVGAGKRDKTID